MKVFSKFWINGAISVKKNSHEEHIKGDPHLQAVDLEKKKKKKKQKKRFGGIYMEKKKKKKLGADTINRWFLLCQ